MDRTVMYFAMKKVQRVITFVIEKLDKRSVFQTGMDLAALHFATMKIMLVVILVIDKTDKNYAILTGMVQIAQFSAERK
jgi:hypothetical protein